MTTSCCLVRSSDRGPLPAWPPTLVRRGRPLAGRTRGEPWGLPGAAVVGHRPGLGLPRLELHPADVDLPRRILFQELGGFLPTYAHAQDYEFFVRLLRQERFQRIGRTLAGARRHDDAMSMDRNAVHLAELEAIAEQQRATLVRRRVGCTGTG